MQVPAPFEYERATSVEHAVALLERHGPEARAIAGGHSLLPMMKLRLAFPEFLVDLNDLRDDLDFIRERGGEPGELCIGALVTHRALLESELVFENFPIFRDAERVIADPIVRNRGTIGGSLCQADPSEDLSAVCAALKARCVIIGRAAGNGAGGTGLTDRSVGMGDFYVGPYETAVGQSELLTEVRLPMRPGHGSAYEKVERRAGDWAIAAAGAAVWLDGGVVADAGISLAAVGLRGVSAEAAEDALRGGPPTEDRLAQAARLAAEQCEPTADQRGPVDYKLHLAKELTLRALRRAVGRALGQEA
jgi:carbon-monoxide dehydrogenase medium subunit